MIRERLGVGAMGTVYLGRHSLEARALAQGGDVAIKMMHPHYATNPQFRKRFRREAELGFRLDHPGIVKVLDFVVDGTAAALVMEFCEGRVLSQVAGRGFGPLPWRRAFLVMQQLLEALAYAHGLGVVHRDLKPQNILVARDGSLKVLDFGVAKDLDGSSAETGTGVAIGTVTYMAPEQYLDARSVTATADLYAAALMFFELLTGRLPWEEGVVSIGILGAKLYGQLPAVRDFQDDVPHSFNDLITRALQLKPEDRQESATAMLDALRTGLWAAELDLAPGAQPPESGHYWWDEEVPFPDAVEELSLDLVDVLGSPAPSDREGPTSLTQELHPEHTNPTLFPSDAEASHAGRPVRRRRIGGGALLGVLVLGAGLVLFRAWSPPGPDAGTGDGQPSPGETMDSADGSGALGGGRDRLAGPSDELVAAHDDVGPSALEASALGEAEADPGDASDDGASPAADVGGPSVAGGESGADRGQGESGSEASSEGPADPDVDAVEAPPSDGSTASTEDGPEAAASPTEPATATDPGVRPADDGASPIPDASPEASPLRDTPPVAFALRHAPPSPADASGDTYVFEARLQGAEGPCTVHWNVMMAGGSWVGMYMEPVEGAEGLHRGRFAVDYGVGDVVQYYLTARCGEARTQAGSQSKPFRIKWR